MGNVPLHPAIVHLPLGLAMLAPVIALIVLVPLWRGRLPRRAWGLVVLLQAALVATAFVALRTGEAEEETVEPVVAEQALETHEERATLFTWAGVAVLALALGAALTLGRAEKVGLGLAAATVVAGLAVTGLGIWTGHAGGQLVYQHGAASAYATPGATGALEASAQRADDDDEHERRGG